MALVVKGIYKKLKLYKMLYKKVLNPEYQLSEKDIDIIKTSYEQLTKTDIDANVLYSCLVEGLIESCLNEIDYRHNWGKIDTHSKRWFLMYVIYPIHVATTYKEILRIVYNQHSMNVTFRNTILLMFSYQFLNQD